VDPRTSTRALARDYIATATIWIPFGVVLVTWLLWRDALPADLPRQYGTGGVVSTIPLWLASLGTIVLTLGAAICSACALPRGAAAHRRPIFLAAGFIAGFACAVWLITTAPTIAAGGVPESIGAWPLLVLVAATYGFIPFLITGVRFAHNQYA
jgi:hypothetical protein